MTPQRLPFLLAPVAAALVLAACGGSSSSGGATAATAGSAGTGISTSRTAAGPVLVDGSGRTLYVFAKDTGPMSTCHGGCATDWPPFTATSIPKAGPGVKASALSLARGSGTRQVLVAGHPVYRYLGDTAAGQSNGQGISAFGAKWWVVAPSGNRITAALSSGPAPRGY